jgi:hypothetical protein
MFAFDASTHTYTLDGARLPSVTEVLKITDPDAFAFVREEVLAAKRDLGRAVHKMIELDANDDLDESSLAPPLTGYLEKWREFRERTGFVVEHCELQLYSARYGYAGTLDLLGHFRSRPLRKALIDTKSGAVPKTAGPQTAGYAQLLEENGICQRPDRYVLDLKETRWSLTDAYTDPNDLRVFLGALSVLQFQRKKAA